MITHRCPCSWHLHLQPIARRHLSFSYTYTLVTVHCILHLASGWYIGYVLVLHQPVSDAEFRDWKSLFFFYRSTLRSDSYWVTFEHCINRFYLPFRGIFWQINEEFKEESKGQRIPRNGRWDQSIQVGLKHGTKLHEDPMGTKYFLTFRFIFLFWIQRHIILHVVAMENGPFDFQKYCPEAVERLRSVYKRKREGLL